MTNARGEHRVVRVNSPREARSTTRHGRLRRPAVAATALTFLLGGVPLLAQAVQTVSAPEVRSDLLLVARQPNTLTATSRIVTTPASPVGVTNLLRVDAQGKALYSLGHLTDDGKAGDAVAGDGIYTLRFSLDGSAAGTVRLRTFAAFKVTTPVLSPVTDLSVPAVTAPIRSAVRDVFTDTPVNSAEISVDGFGRRIARRQLEIVFRSTATAGEVNQLLSAIGAMITGSVGGTRSLVVRIPDPGSLPALETLISRISAAPVVWFVRKGVFAEAEALPENILVSSEPDLLKIDHHLAVKAHAAWNVRAAATTTPRVVVVDEFGAGAPNPLYLSYVPVSAGDFSIGPSDDHGYHVLGIISGSFGGLPTDSGFVTGIYPAAVELRAGDILGHTEIDIDQLIIYRTLTTRFQVLNTSMGRFCTQNGPCTNVDDIKRDAVVWIEKVRTRGLEGRLLHVTAAGNIKEDFPAARDAQTKSTWSAAALIPDLRDELGEPVPNLTNTLVVENASQIGSRARPYAVDCLHTSSFVGGNLSAIGTDVWSLTAVSAAYKTGTSMASPQVAGLAAYLWSIDPSLTPQQIASKLNATANPVPRGLEAAATGRGRHSRSMRMPRRSQWTGRARWRTAATAT